MAWGKITLRQKLILGFMGMAVFVAFTGGYHVYRHYNELKPEPTAGFNMQIVVLITTSSFLLAIGLGRIIVESIVAPIEKFKQAADKIAEGNFDVSIDLNATDEFAEFASTFNYMVKELQTFRETLQTAYEEAETEVRERTKELAAAYESLRIENAARKETEAKLRDALIAEEAAGRAKSEFLANMSHEFTTPLNSVIGFAQLLQDRLYGELTEDQKEYVNNILNSGMNLLGIITNIIDLSKMTLDGADIRRSRFRIRELLRSSVMEFNKEALRHNIRLSLETDPDADIEIEADLEKFSHIMSHLLSNAVKFTPEGGSVQVSARRIQDSGFTIQDTTLCPPFAKGGVKGGAHHESGIVHPDADFIEISVADTGIGIRPEDMPNLFEPMKQLESPSTKRYSGAGVGLMLTKKLVELHEGRIQVESEYGKGSRFTFVMPIKQ